MQSRANPEDTVVRKRTPSVVVGPWPAPGDAPFDYAECADAARTAVARVAGRFGLRPSEADDLHGDLWVRLLEHDGRVLRAFRRTARIDSYLTTVAAHLIIDRRRKSVGKWRPSARALRAQPGAVELERLIVRDGLTPGAAVDVVVQGRPVEARRDLLRFAWSTAPRLRAREVPLDALGAYPADGPSPFELVAANDAARAGRSLVEALGAALATIDASDRDLLMWRYLDRVPVADLAQRLRVDQKALYRRFDRLRTRLRTELEAAGFDTAAVLSLLGQMPDSAGSILRYRRRLPTASAKRQDCAPPARPTVETIEACV